MIRRFPVRRVTRGGVESVEDAVVEEAPLEVRVEGKPVAVIMRTPGHDLELAAGFALSESLIHSAADLFEVSTCGSDGTAVQILLMDPAKFDETRFTRHVFTSSSCGVCGRVTIERLKSAFPAVDQMSRFSAAAILAMPDALRGKQEVFTQTGGIHAAGLFDESGHLLVLREDVGRHNAVDKVIGCGVRSRQLPLSRHALMVSGRVSFEIMQKAWAAGIPVVCAVSAPSSMAIEVAEESGQTLIAFSREGRFNVYRNGGHMLE